MAKIEEKNPASEDLTDTLASKKSGRKLRKNLEEKKPVAEGSPPGFPKKWEKIKEEKPVAEGSPEGFQKKTGKKAVAEKNLLQKGHTKDSI